MVTEKLRRELGFRDVLGFYVVSGLSLRWVATAAASGQSSILVWLFAFVGFFLPLAGCVLELSSRYPQEGGLYVWTREAYGDFPAFIAAWSYWMSNLPYFPAVLYFAAGSFLFAAPQFQHLANSNIYYLLFTVGWLAFITVLNVVGLNAAKLLNNLGAVGLVLPIAVLILLGIFSYTRFGSATRFTLAGAIPHAHVKTWSSGRPYSLPLEAARQFRSWAKKSRNRGEPFRAPCWLPEPSLSSAISPGQYRCWWHSLPAASADWAAS